METINRRLFVALAGASAIVLAGCSSETEEEEVVIPDLTGQWAQTNSGSEDSYMIATIVGEVIKVYWYSIDENSGETTSLYWAGTYVAPESDEAYTWESENDHDQTDSALLASSADTKEFAYEDGVLSFEVTALGTTTTVTMEKTSDEVDELEAAAAAEDPQPMEIVESGYHITSDGYVRWGICWQNPNSAHAIENPQLTITGYEADGSIVFVDTSYMWTTLCPGEIQYIAGSSYDTDGTATVEFSIVDEGSYTESDETAVERYTIGNVSASQDDDGYWTFTGEITANLEDDDASAAQISVILRDADGAIIYGDCGYADLAAVGVSAPFEVELYDDEVPSFASYELYGAYAY